MDDWLHGNPTDRLSGSVASKFIVGKELNGERGKR